MMAEARIPVDLFNPGQVLACMGLLEAADVLLGEAEGGFDWDDATAHFLIRAGVDENPVATVLEFLEKADVMASAPPSSKLNAEKLGKVRIELSAGDIFPFPEPDSPATLPCVLRDADGRHIELDHWGDATSRDTMKFWAGMGGYSGAALARDALDLIRGRLTKVETIADPFSLSEPQSSSFRLDFRGDYIAIDAGFSPNKHDRITPRGYPLVEILAALGLQSARPSRLNRLAYRYAAAAEMLPPALMRAVLGCAPLPFARRCFLMQLGWPGQEGQARCITTVTEQQT